MMLNRDFHLTTCQNPPVAENRTVIALLAGLLLAVSCDGDSGSTASSSTPSTAGSSTASTASSPTSSAPTTINPTSAPGSVETIATNLNTPWDIDFLPDDSALVTSRDTAEILHVSADGAAESLGTVPGVETGSEGGLLGLAIRDDNAYVYVTTATDNRVLRLPLDGGSLGEPEVILDGLDHGSRHQGGRLLFGPDDMLYVTVGDADDPASPQDLSSLNGKILRMTPDGDVPDDNPFDGTYVYSYGHRNVQGLAFDDDGRLWASEFGTGYWDELNLIEPGGNYGWPTVEGPGGAPEFIDPKVSWETEEASPSGVAYHDGSIYMAALRGQRLWQIPLDDDRAGEPQAHFTDEYGRLRHVAAGPDGGLWILTNNTDGRARVPFPSTDDDRILRVTPVP
jgi:glucose/arabinose dehydrogenase